MIANIDINNRAHRVDRADDGGLMENHHRYWGDTQQPTPPRRRRFESVDNRVRVCA